MPNGMIIKVKLCKYSREKSSPFKTIKQNMEKIIQIILYHGILVIGHT